MIVRAGGLFGIKFVKSCVMDNKNQYTKKLRVVVKENIASGENRPGVVQEYLDSLHSQNPNYAGERRREQRIEVELRAIIHLHKWNNEVAYLPAMIRNISASGAMLEIMDKGHILAEAMDQIERFAISFFVPGEAEPVMVECQPRRIEVDNLVGVGAEFTSLSGPDQRYIM